MSPLALRFLASMGPRAFAHGDPINDLISSALFEASMGPRAFAHGDEFTKDMEQHIKDRFNGAAGFRPRRPDSPWRSVALSSGLQWGRGLSPTETCGTTAT